MAAISDPYSSVLEVLHSSQTVSYIDVSAVALYIWDYFITFDMEVDLVWKSQWTFMKCLFIVQRYMPFIDSVGLMPYQHLAPNVTVIQCQEVYQALGWMMLTGTLLSELLLALRVWAVWGRAKWPTIILALSFVVLWSPDFYYMHQFLKSVRFGPRPYPGFLGCFLLGGQDVLFLCFVFIMIWNIGTLIFILIPGFKAYQAGGNSALFHVVYRDGVTYYLYLVVLSFLNVVAIKTFPFGTRYMFLSIQRCLHTILASRVLLHIRQHVKNERENLSEAVKGPEVNVSVYDIRASSRLVHGDRTRSWFGFYSLKWYKPRGWTERFERGNVV